MASGLLRALRSPDVDVVAASERGMVHRSDEDHLTLAAAERRLLYSFNVSDFQRIHTHWLSTERTHAGIVLAQQKRFAVGVQMHKLMRIIGTLTAKEMRGRLEFLGNW